MPNMLGAYGEWAAAELEDPPQLSFRHSQAGSLREWQPRARKSFHDALLQPKAGPAPKVVSRGHSEFQGLSIERLEWQMPYGPPTQALLLKPAGFGNERLPAVIGLHDHGGNKYFGLRKITRTDEDIHPMMVKHQEHYYGGVAWANELALRGYVVLVHDAFTFGSRRMRAADLPDVIRRDLREPDPNSEGEIRQYNQFAANHEHIIAKSLFCAGTTWPGVFVNDDQRALDYLCSRADVDPKRVGCCGLSGGGLRTVFLTGADSRIQCSSCAGMMTTWRDYLLNKSHTHTWMVYVPGLPRQLDYPEILGLNVPNPVLVLNNREDSLFTMPEMERADQILAAVYRKAGAADHYRGRFYPGPHKFDREMQTEAFSWFDRWLKK